MAAETTGLCGILVVDKPLGWSSMTVIRKVRAAAGNRKLKAGHAGTLDPLATGVVVVCIGKATKTVDQVMGQTKVYEAEVDLSAFTTTDDREGEREEVVVQTPPNESQVREVLTRFVGEVEQTPPIFSAIHINGQRAYKLARRGETILMPRRIVRIDAVELLAYHWPLATIRVTCGKGTYIRTLARDIGKALGTGGHLASLRRTAVGDFRIEQATAGNQLPQPLLQEHLMAMASRP